MGLALLGADLHVARLPRPLIGAFQRLSLPPPERAGIAGEVGCA
jgi:hypothetical protein